MKSIRRFLDPSLRWAWGFVACAAFGAERNPAVPVVIAPSPGAAVSAAEKPGPATAAQDSRPARLSAGLDEILRLHQAGVEESVVLAFIQNSPIAYYPTAQEVVTLRDRGITAPVLTALLQHGAEVRLRNAAAIASSPTAPAATTPPPVPEPVRVASAAPVVYETRSPAVIYSSYPSYSYSFGGGYSPYYYSSCYSRGSYGYFGGFFPGISVGLGFGGRFGGHSGGHVSTIHGSFHGGRH